MALALVVRLQAAGQRSTVIVRPAEIQDVLVNPGMGITTFQRSNGQALNPGLEWSEEGPTTKLPQAFLKPTFRTLHRLLPVVLGRYRARTGEVSLGDH
jgi:hypothetical protein